MCIRDSNTPLHTVHYYHRWWLSTFVSTQYSSLLERLSSPVHSYLFDDCLMTVDDRWWMSITMINILLYDEEELIDASLFYNAFTWHFSIKLYTTDLFLRYFYYCVQYLPWHVLHCTVLYCTVLYFKLVKMKMRTDFLFNVHSFSMCEWINQSINQSIKYLHRSRLESMARWILCF